MTDTSITLYVTTHDLELGLARRDCPTCKSPLLIRLPSMAEAFRDRHSAALRLGLDCLTRGQRDLFDVVYAAYPRAVTREATEAALVTWGAALRVSVTRTRKRLAAVGWQLISHNNSLRLVAPE